MTRKELKINAGHAKTETMDFENNDGTRAFGLCSIKNV